MAILVFSWLLIFATKKQLRGVGIRISFCGVHVSSILDAFGRPLGKALRRQSGVGAVVGLLEARRHLAFRIDDRKVRDLLDGFFGRCTLAHWCDGGHWLLGSLTTETARI